MPIDSPVFGSGSGFSTSQEKATNHLPARQKTRAVLIVPSMLRCQRTAIRPMPKSFEATAVDLEAVAVLLEAEPRESIPDLEPGIAGILASLDSAEERLERLVQIGHDVLKDVAVDVQRKGAGGFLHLDLAKLHGLGDRLASFLVSLLALATASIVEVAARLAHGFQPAALALAGVQAVDECLEHLLGVRFLCCLADHGFEDGRLGGTTLFGELDQQPQGCLGEPECRGDLFVLHPRGILRKAIRTG